MKKYSADELKQKYIRIAHGTARISAIKAAIQQADLEKDIGKQLQFRLDLIEESVFYGDSLDALVTFPQVLAMEEQNPGHANPHDLCWDFKWILTASPEFPQISLKEIDSYFEEYKKRCKKHGYSLRSYYHKTRSVYMYIDAEKAEEANRKMQLFPRDDMSDCLACELNAQVEYDIFTGQVDKAFKEVEPILNNELSCSEVPGMTYSVLMNYYCKKHDEEKAKEYFNLLYQLVFKKKAFGLTGETVGNMLFYCGLYDKAQGVELFRKVIKEENENKNPYLAMEFARGAYFFFHALQEEREFLNITLPQMPIAKTKDGYQVAELAKFYYDKYTDLAKRFDERNGNSYYMEQII